MSSQIFLSPSLCLAMQLLKLIMLSFFRWVKVLQCIRKTKASFLYEKQDLEKQEWGFLDLPQEIPLSIFSYVPLYNIFISVQGTHLAWRYLCSRHILLKEVHYSKEFDEILTKRELLAVPRQVSRDIHCLDIASACTENDFPKLIQ